MADMKKSRFSDEQSIGLLKQAEDDVLVNVLRRKGGFSDATFYKRRARFGGTDVPDARDDGNDAWVACRSRRVRDRLYFSAAAH